MAKMWAVTKMSINAIPAPKSLQELEYLLMTMGSIVSQKLALLKALAGGKHPNLQNKLESLGHNPDRGTVQSSEIYFRMEIYPAFSLVEENRGCTLIGRELHNDEIF